MDTMNSVRVQSGTPSGSPKGGGESVRGVTRYALHVTRYTLHVTRYALHVTTRSRRFAIGAPRLVSDAELQLSTKLNLLLSEKTLTHTHTHTHTT